MARGEHALVVGNPKTDFCSLKGAEMEARKAADVFRDNGYKVREHLGEKGTTMDIPTALYAEEYRIIHLAGHGVLEAMSPDASVSGMVIGPDEYLTPALIDKMRTTPELVFINCCHIGRVEEKIFAPGELPYLAANLAAQLIRMGVRVVVAAGWAVDDKAAGAFAEYFYGEMFSGATFGDAVRKARGRIHD